MSRTSHYLVPVALVATGLAVLFAPGCRKRQEEAKAPDRASPESYMKDPVFRKGLSERSSAQRKIVAERAEYVARMEKLAEETRRRMGVTMTPDGRDLLKEELEKQPEWKELYAKVTALNESYEAGRKDLLKYTRERITPERITPKKPISK